MIDERKIAQYNVEMAEHANGAAQYLSALIGGRFVTREQTRDMADYVLAQTKRNIESCPFASQEEKEAEICRKEFLMNMLKSRMGL
jgi:predicted Zn-dependent peptidase